MEENSYVDLGLSVKWATCNVGASKPEEYGNYYAWGELNPKNDYSWNSYRLCKFQAEKNKKNLMRYNTVIDYGNVDNKIELDSSDDIANKLLGGKWRMPTESEIRELLHHCSWRYISQNNYGGYLVSSNKTGGSIFLPAAGYRNIGSLIGERAFGAYWSRNLVPDFPIGAYYLYFSIERAGFSEYYRYCGHTIRPVLDK